MRSLSPPFKFRFGNLIATARRKLNNRVGGITISLPFISIGVCPDDLEQQVAREIVIRMADRRVLNSFECCDGEAYFAALEMLRGHLYRCLAQVSAIAKVEIPKITRHMRYDSAWETEAYEKPRMLAD